MGLAVGPSWVLSAPPLMQVCACACMCVCVHMCDSLQGRPQLGWETAEFLLSVALRKRWVINSISPEVLWFHMHYQRETRSHPERMSGRHPSSRLTCPRGHHPLTGLWLLSVCGGLCGFSCGFPVGEDRQALQPTPGGDV